MKQRQIKKDTQIFVEMDMYAKHCDQKRFLDFDPEKNWGTYVKHGDKMSFGTLEWKDLRASNECPFMAVPFGAGPRRCAGQKLARKVMKYQLHNILNIFDFDCQYSASPETPRTPSTVASSAESDNPQEFSSSPESAPFCSPRGKSQQKISWTEYFKPYKNHKFSGRQNDGKESEENLGYILRRLGEIIGQFAFDRGSRWLKF